MNLRQIAKLDRTKAAAGLLGLEAATQSEDANAVSIKPPVQLVERAYKRMAQGDDARDIWRDLRVYFDRDGEAKTLLPDTKLTLKPEGIAALNETDSAGNFVNESIKLKDYIDHPALFNYNPELGERIVKRVSSKDADAGIGGKYHPDGSISVNMFKDNKTQKSNIVHEIQHMINDSYGWAKGGSDELFSPLRSEAYATSAGQFDRSARAFRSQKREIDTRLAQARARGDTEAADEYYQKSQELGAKADEAAATAKQHAYNSEILDPYEQYKRLIGEWQSRHAQAIHATGDYKSYPLDTPAFDDVPEKELFKYYEDSPAWAGETTSKPNVASDEEPSMLSKIANKVADNPTIKKAVQTAAPYVDDFFNTPVVNAGEEGDTLVHPFAAKASEFLNNLRDSMNAGIPHLGDVAAPSATADLMDKIAYKKPMSKSDLLLPITEWMYK
jgi:hypothetical protein